MSMHRHFTNRDGKLSLLKLDYGGNLCRNMIDLATVSDLDRQLPIKRQG